VLSDKMLHVSHVHVTTSSMTERASLGVRTYHYCASPEEMAYWEAPGSTTIARALADAPPGPETLVLCVVCSKDDGADVAMRGVYFVDADKKYVRVRAAREVRLPGIGERAIAEAPVGTGGTDFVYGTVLGESLGLNTRTDSMEGGRVGIDAATPTCVARMARWCSGIGYFVDEKDLLGDVTIEAHATSRPEDMRRELELGMFGSSTGDRRHYIVPACCVRLPTPQERSATEGELVERDVVRLRVATQGTSGPDAFRMFDAVVEALFRIFERDGGPESDAWVEPLVEAVTSATREHVRIVDSRVEGALDASRRFGKCVDRLVSLAGKLPVAVTDAMAAARREIIWARGMMRRGDYSGKRPT